MAFYPCVLSWVTDNVVALGLFPDLATIREEPTAATAIRDASGGIDRTYPTAWRTLGTAIPCRLVSVQSGGQEADYGGKPAAEKKEVIYFAAGQAISPTCRIEITSLKRYKAGDDPDDDALWDSPVFDVVFPHIVSNELMKAVEVKERI